MSKFKYTLIWSRSAALSPSTYWSDPSRPTSSAAQKANRTLFLTGKLLSWIAVSTMAAVPDPLSSMPGPASTLSRCAPSMTTLSGSPLRVSPITL
jgi:hypothetical protein